MKEIRLATGVPDTQADEAIDAGRRALLAGVSEREFQRGLEELLTLYGWQWIRLTDSRKQHAVGWPDLFAFRDRERGSARLLAIECKSLGGKLRPEQQQWLHWLAKAGVETYVLRPGDGERAQRILRRDDEEDGKEMDL